MAESFSGCVVVGPDDILDVLLAVVGKIGFAWRVASENAVGIFNGAALPGRMWIAEEARHAKVAFQILVCGEFRAVVAGDGAPGDPRQAAEEVGEAGGGGLGGLAWQAGGEGQAGLAFDGGQEITSLCAELHEVALPMAELTSVINGLPALMDGAAPRDRFAPAFKIAPAPGRLGPRQIAMQLLTAHRPALDEAIDRLVAHPMLRSFQPEPAGDLLRRPAHRKVVADMITERAQALDP